MFMLEQRIQQQFFEGADLQYQAAETLSRPIAEAAQTLLTAITAGGKVLVCGAGIGASIAHHFSALLLGRLERERPTLAALTLRDDAALAAAADPAGIFARQISALAHPGDVVVIVDGGGEAVLFAAAEAARQQDASVIVLASAATPWAERLSETDVLVAVPHERPSRVVEMQLLVMHCLCDALDVQLLGEQEI
jgi:D-sedoheptulose 7-phosphate isomerase